MAEVIEFNYWLASPQTRNTTTQLISGIEKIVKEHKGQQFIEPTTSESCIHERTYEFNPGALFLKMLVQMPLHGPQTLKLNIEGQVYEAPAIAILCGFGNEEKTKSAIYEELKILRTKYSKK